MMIDDVKSRWKPYFALIAGALGCMAGYMFRVISRAPPGKGATAIRSLTNAEHSAIRLMASQVGDSEIRKQLFKDIEVVQVEVPQGTSRMLLHIPGLRREPYRGQDSFRGADRFPVEGTLADMDGASVEVYIYHVDGRVFELELLRPDGGDVLVPRWDTFRLK